MSSAILRCDECNKKFSVQKSDLRYDEIESTERAMGPEKTYEAEYKIECECENTVVITHHIWMYPEDLINHQELFVDGASVVENKL